MLFKFQCPHCGQRISATAADVGTHNVCPTCNKELVVPRSPAGNSVATPPPLPVRPYSGQDLARDCVWVSLGAICAGAMGVLFRSWTMPLVLGFVLIPHYFREGRKGKPLWPYTVTMVIVFAVAFYLKRNRIVPFEMGW